MELHCEKNIGKEHAKWSPVGMSFSRSRLPPRLSWSGVIAATASYRLLPSIHIHRPVPSDLCDKFARCFPPGVIEVRTDPATGKKEAVVANPRRDTVSREVLRHPEFDGIVSLGRRRDHFICPCRLHFHFMQLTDMSFVVNIESTGAYSPPHLFPEAAKVLLRKTETLRHTVDSWTR
jgi:DNA-directed RNA polymerase I and III subunit RPAC1